MTEVVTVSAVGGAYVRFDCDAGISREIAEKMTFEVPGYKFMPAAKRGWDGKIRLFNERNGRIYAGLRSVVEDFCASAGYLIEHETDFGTAVVTADEVELWAKTIGLPESLEPRPYQLQTVAECITTGRALILSPTSSGKSLLAYLLHRWYGKRTLIIVPTIALVGQMETDFVDYGFEGSIHAISAGVGKDSGADVTVSTWHSIVSQPKAWFDQFDVVIGDEAHLFAAKSLVSIMEKIRTGLRFGMTGTLDGTKTHELVLTGLFGPVFVATTTRELIDAGYASEIDVQVVVLDHDDETRQAAAGVEHQTEIDMLCASEARNRFITRLALSTKGNTLVFFQFIEKHGKGLEAMIRAAAPDRPVYIIHGGKKGDERNRVRGLVETIDDGIFIVSYGTFQAGVNMIRVRNGIFAHPRLTQVGNLQSIGRGLRRNDKIGKTKFTLFDIADDLTWHGKKNTTLRHMIERVKIYAREQFPYRMHRADLWPGKKRDDAKRAETVRKKRA